MAKDGTNRGGSRLGSGKKKTPLRDRLTEGNRNHRPIMVLDFDNISDGEKWKMPPPHEYIKNKQRNGKETLAAEIYEKVWNWLNERECAHLIFPQLIEDYAMDVARCIQCQEFIDNSGLIAPHPTTGNAIASPYVSILQSLRRQANAEWSQIFQIVKDNCTTEYKGAPHDDLMEKLLSGRR